MITNLRPLLLTRKSQRKKISDYRMVTVGDTQPDEIGMHNYAVLLVDVKNKVVKGYAPTK